MKCGELVRRSWSWTIVFLEEGQEMKAEAAGLAAETLSQPQEAQARHIVIMMMIVEG